ncbi:hypothetical protein, partial [Tritonibacter sp. SIMBA_163]
MATLTTPHLRHLTPSQIVKAVTPRLSKQHRRWINRGDRTDVLGVFDAGDRPAVWMRIRPR